MHFKRSLLLTVVISAGLTELFKKAGSRWIVASLRGGNVGTFVW